VTTADGRAAVRRAAEIKADVWIPDDASWAGPGAGLGLAPAGTGGAGTVLATSPFFMVADRPTMVRLQQSGGTWLSLAHEVAGGDRLRLVIRDPAGSGDGMVAAGSVADAVWLDEDMDASALWLADARRTTRIVADGGPALPTAAGEIGLVPEYTLLPAIAGGDTGLGALPGNDHTAMLRYTWFPLAAAVADPVRSAALDRLRTRLREPSAVAAITAANLRAPDSAPKPTATSLPAPAATPFDVFDPHKVDHVFATWYAQDRRTNLLVVVDVSGSMADPAPGSKASRIDLVREGCRSVGALLPDESRMGLWEFGSELDGKRDYRRLVDAGPLDDGQRNRLGRAVGRLKAQETGTGLYDTVLAAYTSARDSYRPGVPNQVLVFTDGRNEDDENSMSAAQLSAALAKAADPQRPVMLSVVTFGRAAEAKVVEDAVKPVNGYVDVLTSAHEVAAVFIHVAAGGLHH
jgi:hypothetical protein